MSEEKQDGIRIKFTLINGMEFIKHYPSHKYIHSIQPIPQDVYQTFLLSEDGKYFNKNHIVSYEEYLKEDTMNSKKKPAAKKKTAKTIKKSK